MLLNEQSKAMKVDWFCWRPCDYATDFVPVAALYIETQIITKGGLEKTPTRAGVNISVKSRRALSPWNAQTDT